MWVPYNFLVEPKEDRQRRSLQLYPKRRPSDFYAVRKAAALRRPAPAVGSTLL